MLRLFFEFAIGFALLLIGMSFMRYGLENTAKAKMNRALRALTGKPWTGFLTGALLTAMVQSSTAVTVITIGLVNAQIMSFQQAIGIILGTNVGTCVTAQMVSLHFDALAIPAILMGLFLFSLKRNFICRNLGQGLIGFGIIFLGIHLMASSLEPLKETRGFIHFLTTLSHNPISGVIAGALFSALIHSSAATTAVVISFARNGLVDLPTAIAIIFGSNIGTCFTGLLAAIGSPREARQVAVSHVLLNIMGVVIFLPFIEPFSKFIQITSSSLPAQIANAHTYFNIASSLVVLPFAEGFANLVRKIVPR